MQAAFPKLAAYDKTSDATPNYNCIAWALGDTARNWWPDATLLSPYYWPDPAAHASLGSFVTVFEGQGYERCDSQDLESGYERLAIFVDDRGVPTHAARQLPSGGWTSKLGSDIDIQHAKPSSLAGPVYGGIAIIMRRQYPKKEADPST